MNECVRMHQKFCIIAKKKKWQNVRLCFSFFCLNTQAVNRVFRACFEVLFDSRPGTNAKTAYIWSIFFFHFLAQACLVQSRFCFSCLVTDDSGRAETAGSSRPRQPYYCHVGAPRGSKPYTTYLELE